MTRNREHKTHAYTKTYAVTRLDGELRMDADWNKSLWQAVQPITIDQCGGERPEHFPHTQAKLMYDNENLYVIFRVEDQYVRCIRENYQDLVFRDSCVEFFFTSGEDIGEGYFNMEINCGGAILFHHQTARSVDEICLPDIDLDRVEIAHSLPAFIPEEIKEPITWTLEYKVPLDILSQYAPVAKPAPGVVWQANFYKCADDTSKPHWLTWSLIDLPVPDFHRPEFFGTLAFK